MILKIKDIELLLAVDDGISITDIKKKIKRIHSSYISIVLTKLFKLNLIDIVNNEEDRRLKCIFLTEKGKEIKLYFTIINVLLEGKK